MDINYFLLPLFHVMLIDTCLSIYLSSISILSYVIIGFLDLSHALLLEYAARLSMLVCMLESMKLGNILILTTILLAVCSAMIFVSPYR